MAAAVPTLATVMTAIKTAMDAVVPDIGTVFERFHTYEDDVSFLERNSLIVADVLSIWFIELIGIDEIEGPASQEFYEVYNIEIEHWSIETDDADWSKTARDKAETVRDDLNGAAAIFAIGGQRQVFTPETISITSHGQREIRGDDKAHMIYGTILSLQVEARRFS